MKNHAFTLIEVLVVISIIAILATISIPIIQSSIAKSDSAKCLGNLRDLGAQITSYAADKGRYPKIYNNNPIWAEIGNWSGTKNPSTWLCPARLVKKNSTGASFTPAYTANKRVFPDAGLPVAAVPRPAQVIALIDAAQRAGSGWAMQQMTVTGATDPASAETALTGQPITQPNTDICDTFACVRYRHNNSANALFLDGHVETKKLGTILQKNISISY